MHTIKQNRKIVPEKGAGKAPRRSTGKYEGIGVLHCREPEAGVESK